jgi:hypothetical protein
MVDASDARRDVEPKIRSDPEPTMNRHLATDEYERMDRSDASRPPASDAGWASSCW